MKKKIKILSLFMVLGLFITACGEFDYTNPKSYYTEIESKVNSIDPEFFDTLDNYLDTTGTKKSFNKFFDAFTDTFGMTLDIYEEESEEVYNNFMESISSVEELNFSTEKLTESLEKYNSLGENLQETFTNLYNSILYATTEILTEVNDYIANLNKEQLEGVKNLNDVIENYLSENDTTFYDEVARILEETK